MLIVLVVNVKTNLWDTDDQSMLLAVAWVTDEELSLMQMFLEVWFMDVTLGTNKEGRCLFLVCGKNSNNKGFTGVSIFVPSEQHWMFDWIFMDCLPTLLSHVIVQHNTLCVTDEDPQMYGALRAQQLLGNPWKGEHCLCKWYLLVVDLATHVNKSIHKTDIQCKVLAKTAYQWIQSCVWTIETIEEFDYSVNLFWDWLECIDDDFHLFCDTKLCIRNFVLTSLLPK